MNRRAPVIDPEMQPLVLENVSEMPWNQFYLVDTQPGAMHVP